MPTFNNIIVASHVLTMDIANIAYLEQKDFVAYQTEEIENMIKLRMQQKIEIKTCKLDKPCSRCKGNEFQLMEVQVRCNDEGATLRALCLKCGHKTTL
jgi:DNA-directed RNA polymerase subunit M/transcription elongation factor TFIIS